MPVGADTLRALISAGLSGDQLVHVVELIDADMARIGAAAPAQVDEAAARRRAKDRERKAESRRKSADIPQKSAETSAEMSADPLPPLPRTESFPHTPFKETQPSTPSSSPNSEQAKPNRRKPNRSIPDGFPDADQLEKAQTRFRQAGVNVDARLQGERFRNHAEQTDRKAADWPAAWRNWIIGAIEREQSRPGFKPVHTAISTPQTPDQQAEMWRFRLKNFREQRYWDDSRHGPRPGLPGCKVPAAILAESGVGPPQEVGSAPVLPFAPRSAA